MRGTYRTTAAILALDSRNKGDAMKWLRLIAGPQPELRVVALLLAVIAVLLAFIYRDLHAIANADPLDICGTGPGAQPLGLSQPCKVEVIPPRNY